MNRILYLIPKSFKKRGYIVLTSIPLRALMDLFGLAVLLPMLFIVLDGSDMGENRLLLYLKDFFKLEDFKFYMVVIGFILFFLILKNLLNLYLLKYQNEFLLDLYRHFSKKKFTQIFNEGLLFIKQSNISKLTYNINAVCYNFVVGYLSSIMKFIGDGFFAMILIVALSIYNPLSALFAIISFIPVVLLYVLLVRRRLKKYGQLEMEHKRDQHKLVMEAFRGYPEMKVNNAYSHIINEFDGGLSSISKYRIKTNILQAIPFYILELVVAIEIAAMVLFSVDAGDSSMRIFLGVFAVAMVRLIPTVRSLISSWGSIKSTIYTVDVIHDIQDTEIKCPNNTEIVSFDKVINVENISFSYDGYPVIQNLSFQIEKGDVFGIKGKTGSGKSTLFNLLLGLYEPNRGEIFIDNFKLSPENLSSWHKIVGYVPQDVFIADGSIVDNIALGLDPIQIDRDKVSYAIKQSSLEEFVLSLPNGIDTQVGDYGSRISGGQKQRIGIARALYKGAKVLFFDEATSSLDTQTEKDINDEILKLSKTDTGLTIIIIAHRTDSLKICNKILEL